MANRLWRIALYMIRKGGVISKRKLMVDMNLMMKRGRILRKSLGNLMFHHHHSSKHATSSTNYYTSTGGFSTRNHYEFSCSNSPNPLLFHMSKWKHHYFPCINVPSTRDVDEDQLVEDQYWRKAVVAVPRIEYSPAYDHDDTYNYSSFRFAIPDLAPGEKLSPLLNMSPFSAAVRISNCSSEEENDVKNFRAQKVDEDAEEFIRKFYEQLRVQSSTYRLH